MAFKIQNLSVLNYANGFTLWHYRTTDDNKDDIDTQGYFNSAHEMIRKDDMIIVNTATATGIVVINKNSNGMVDSTDFGGLLTSDGD